jgi:hypothetical protein
MPGVLCQGDAATCYSVETLTELPGRVNALTPTGDGRLLVIHDRRHVRVIAQGVLLPDAALTSAPGVEISGVALDPAFDRNRHVYVGEVETRADGSRTMAVRRYREVVSTLAEGATIVASLPLPRTGDAPFTIDAVGRIYLAIPSAMDDSAGGLPYAGLVLRFERDGTVSRDSRAGSPIIARGFDRPVSLVWNSATDALWLAGSTMQGAADLVQLPLQTASSEWPRMPARADVAAELPVATLSSGPRAARGARVLAIDDTGSLLQIDAATREVVNSLDLADLGRDAASAALDDGSIYLALSGPAATSQIVRLRRQ